MAISPSYTPKERADALNYALALMRDRLRVEAPMNAEIIERHIYALIELIASGCQAKPTDSDVLDIQQRCRLAAEQLETLAGSPNDLIASLNPHQWLFLEAASLVRGYHQCLLVESVLTRASGAR